MPKQDASIGKDARTKAHILREFHYEHKYVADTHA